MTQQAAVLTEPAATTPSPANQVPSPEDILPLQERTVPSAVARALARHPDRPALVEPLGRTLTYRQLDHEARRVAASLHGLGLLQGDNVMAMLDPHADNVVAWVGANIASVVWVPINTSYKGSLLQFVVEHSEARAIVIEREWVERVVHIADQLTHLRVVIVRGGVDGLEMPANLELRTFESLQDAEPIELPEPRVTDISTIMYTSGTEGQSKGVMIPHGAVYAASISHARTVETEVVLTCLPFFHAGGLFTGPFQALRTGGTVILHGTFSAARFLDDVRTYRATTTLVVGPIALFLLSLPPSPADRDHELRNVIMFPVINRVEEFAERFGVPVAAGYGCTEISAALLSKVGEGRAGMCGEPVPHYEVALVDEFDTAVGPGELGELVIRPREPSMMSPGYFKAPEKTVAAWTNLWFHTGDLMRFDSAIGQYEFVDRRKDVLRRRGENISSVEVERHLVAAPGVQEAAVIAAPSSVGEDEICAVLVAAPGATIDPAEVLETMYHHLPYFMVPRYFDVVAELPKTQTMKVQKAALRAQGMSAQVWDCEAAGYRVTRTQLVRPA